MTCEYVRALSAGVLEAGAGTIFLLIAIRHFDAGPATKGLIAGGSSIGSLLTPFLVFAAQYFGTRTNVAISLLLAASAISLFVAAVSSTLAWFVFGTVLSAAAFASITPFIAQIYRENYPETDRGQILGRTTTVRVLAAVVTALGAGWLLEGRIEEFGEVLFLMSALLALAAIAMLYCPTTKGARLQMSELLTGLRALKTEKSFQLGLAGWMILGLGLAIIIPIRTEYLAQFRDGFSLSEFEITALVISVPNLGKLIMYPLWGRWFDHQPFAKVRVIANCMSILSILTFFTSDSASGLIVGSLIQGAAIAGGELTWTLWPTTLGHGSRVASLTAVHAFFTGVRGVLGPFIGFQLLSCTSSLTVAGMAAILVSASIPLFVIEAKCELFNQAGSSNE